MTASENLGAAAQVVSYRAPMTFKDHLKAAMDRLDVDQSELARRLKVSPSAVNQWVRGKTVPTHRRIQTVADALGIPLNSLLTGPHSSVTDTLPPSNARIAKNAPGLPDFQALVRDIPVLGTAQGGPDGAFILNMDGGVIDWARRPAGLIGLQGIFALYLEGDCMIPWRNPGSLIYVTKARPPHIGSHVVVVLEGEHPGDPPVSYVKKLVRRTAERIELEQYNPAARVCVPTNRVRELLRVLEWEEVLGI